MFAARYFAPRYFAPRYFPEHGASVNLTLHPGVAVLVITGQAPLVLITVPSGNGIPRYFTTQASGKPRLVATAGSGSPLLFAPGGSGTPRVFSGAAGTPGNFDDHAGDFDDARGNFDEATDPL
jgi:hypothetical protein